MTDLADEPGTTEPGSLDELFGLVRELKQGIEDVKEGSVDRSTVEEMLQAAAAQSRRLGSANPFGFVPENAEEDVPTRGKLSRLQGVEREQFLLQTPAKELAPLMRRPTEVVERYQQAHDTLVLLAAMTKKAPEELDYFHDFYLPARQQSMDTKTTGEGKELVIPEISTDVIEAVEGQLQVLSLFPVVNMPSNPFRFPTKGPRKHVAILPEALEPGVPKAKKLLPAFGGFIELNATKFAGEIVTSKELEEDAAIAILPFLEEELTEWLSYDLENATVNGDTAATHIDDGITGGIPADDPSRGWDGLRKLTPATAKVDNGGGAIDLAKLLSARAAMGRYGLSPSDVVLLMSVSGLYDLIGNEKVMTVDTYGPNATLISGELGRIWGVPIIASDTVPVDCDAAGVRVAAGTQTIAMFVRASAYMHGVRRNTTVQVLTELYAESDQDAVLLTTRQAFAPRYPGEPTVAQLTNIG